MAGSSLEITGIFLNFLQYTASWATCQRVMNTHIIHDSMMQACHHDCIRYGDVHQYIHMYGDKPWILYPNTFEQRQASRRSDYPDNRKLEIVNCVLKQSVYCIFSTSNDIMFVTHMPVQCTWWMIEVPHTRNLSLSKWGSTEPTTWVAPRIQI